MSKKYLFTLFFCITFLSYGQKTSEFCEQLSALNSLIQEKHYRPKILNDSLSKHVHDLFLEYLDEDNHFFTDKDIAALSVHELQLDNFISENDCSFLQDYIHVYKKRISFVNKLLWDWEDFNFDYSGKETIKFYRTEKMDRPANEAELYKIWNKGVRFEILRKLTDEDSLYDNIASNFETLEQTIKPKILASERCKLEELLSKDNGVSEFVQKAFLNAFANYQDPNTFFLSPSEKTFFQNSLSSDQKSFGIETAKNEEGKVIISYIIPGSDASKASNLEENDILLSLTTASGTLETYCVSNEDIYDFLTDAIHETVTLKVKKKDGSIKTIKLRKSEISVPENLTRGFVLERNEKIGYINIPSFYTDFESPNGLGVANDVANEIYKLKKEGVQGLILDLRYNGGGSMKEASDLCGAFIDRGPLSIIKYNNGETYTVRDSRRGSLSDWPLVILINAYSASASEFFAGTMQDYNRAIIVGSPSYGKSSAQLLLPLDETEKLGYCKLTTDAFFRVTGKSSQSIGVQPDILLPSIFKGFEINEQFMPYALSSDSVAVSMKHHQLDSLPLGDLLKKSNARVAKNEGFQLIVTSNTVIVEDYLKKDSEYPLSLQHVFNDLDTYNTTWKTLISYFDAREDTMSVMNTASTNELLLYDPEQEEINRSSREDLSKDLYVEEAYSILTDYLHLKH